MKSEWCSYRRVNLILGLFTFLVAAIVYGSTVEPTSSFGIAVNLFYPRSNYR